MYFVILLGAIGADRRQFNITDQYSVVIFGNC